MTRQLLAMLGCYTLGLVAGSADKTAPVPVIHCVEAQRSVSTEPAVQQDTKRSPVVQPVKTPLVSKLLPGPLKPTLQGLSNDDIVRIYSENEAAIAAIWMEDEGRTMRDAVEIWCKRQHNESEAMWLKNNATLPKPPKPTIQDGQLSPRGEWQWSSSQGAWVPVAKAGPRWVQDGHSATIDHLVRDHGYRRADLVKLTQSQLDVLHSNAHNSARARRVSAPTASYCPSGRCPRR